MFVLFGYVHDTSGASQPPMDFIWVVRKFMDAFLIDLPSTLPYCDIDMELELSTSPSLPIDDLN